MSRLRTLLPFLLLILAAAYIVAHSMRRDADLAGTAPTVAEREPLYVAEQATWTRYAADGAPQVRAQAAEINYYDDRSITMTTVTLDRLGSTQGHWHLEAPRGSVPADAQRMLLQPDVAIRGESNRDLPTTIAARDVWVDWDKRTISSDQAVHGTAPNRAVSAQGWQTDFDATQIRMTGQVEVQYDAPRR